MSAAPILPPHRHRFTVQEYHRLAESGLLRADERVELIDGEIIHMSPIGKRHASVVARLDRHFQKLGDRVFVWVQSPVVMDAHGEPEPDLALLRPRSDDYEERKPEPGDVHLMIEVGDSSLSYELNTKRQYYADHGIAELWIVDAIRKIIHVCRDPRDGEYHDVMQKQGDETLAPLAFPDFVASVRNMIG